MHRVYFSIYFYLIKKVNATLYIYSIEGKVMKTQRLTEGTNSVDMYDFKAGIYSFKVITNNDVKTFKVIKE